MRAATTSLRDRTQEWNSIVERLQKAQVRLLKPLWAAPVARENRLNCIAPPAQGASAGPYSQNGGGCIHGRGCRVSGRRLASSMGAQLARAARALGARLRPAPAHPLAPPRALSPPPPPRAPAAAGGAAGGAAGAARGAAQQQSEFARRASAIGLAIHKTSLKLQKLAALAKRTSMFDDPGAEIEELTGVVKRDIQELNEGIAELQRVSARRGGEGGANKQSAEHSHTVVDSLRTRLKDATAEFKEVRRAAVFV
jgi:hypothetical protein